MSAASESRAQNSSKFRSEAGYGLVDPPFSEEHPEHSVAEQGIQAAQMNLRECKEPAGWTEHLIRDPRMQVRVEVHEVPEGLDGDDDPGDGRLALAGRAEEGLEGLGDTLA